MSLLGPTDTKIKAAEPAYHFSAINQFIRKIQGKQMNSIQSLQPPCLLDNPIVGQQQHKSAVFTFNPNESTYFTLVPSEYYDDDCHSNMYEAILESPSEYLSSWK